MRIYIAGPIAGYEDGNRAAFKERAALITSRGHTPVNPHEIDHSHPGMACIGPETGRGDDPHLYGCYLRADVIELMTCQGYTVLRGWHESKGARAERHIAFAVGLKLMMEELWPTLDSVAYGLVERER
jgi:hypothetical protein